MSTATDAAAAGRRAAATAEPHQTIRKWPATATVMLGMMTVIMASTMINIAIADIMGAYGVGQDRVQWLQTGFLSATTVFMLLNAWFMHNFGARNTFILAATVFSVASVFGQFAPDFESLVLARVVQGACAGLIQPLSLSVIFMAFPPNERGKAMGLFGVGTMMGPALGPLYGGLIIDAIDWRFVFTGSVPFMLLGAVMAARYLPGRGVGTPKARLNWVSLGLVAVAISTLLNGVTLGQREGWESLTVLILLVTAALATMAFIEVESRTAHPLLNVRLFANRSFLVVSLVGVVYGAGMFGTFYLLPIFLRTVQGFTGTKAGLLLLSTSIITFIVFPIAGWLSQRVKPVYPVVGGSLLFAVSSFALSFVDADTSFGFLVGWSSVGYAGLGLALPALTAAGLQGLGRDLVAYGAGTMNFMRMLGGAFGVNFLAMILDSRADYYAESFTATQTAANDTTRDLIDGVVGLLAQGGVSSADRLPMAMIYLGDVISARAEALSFQDGYLALAVAFGLATLCALTLARNRPIGAEA